MQITSQESLRSLLHYDPATGIFRWLKDGRYKRTGKIATCKAKRSGYAIIWNDGEAYYAHRLAWLYCKGEWPREMLDHINGVRDDNRLANLRECDRAQNAINAKLNASNSSGFKGVFRDKGQWRARIRVNKKRISLGCFPTAEEAAAAYNAAAFKFHGEFVRLNEAA